MKPQVKLIKDHIEATILHGGNPRVIKATDNAIQSIPPHWIRLMPPTQIIACSIGKINKYGGHFLTFNSSTSWKTSVRHNSSGAFSAMYVWLDDDATPKDEAFLIKEIIVTLCGRLLARSYIATGYEQAFRNHRSLIRKYAAPSLIFRGFLPFFIGGRKIDDRPDPDLESFFRDLNDTFARLACV